MPTDEPPLPSAATEPARASLLEEYRILGTAPGESLDDLTELASVICGTPISLVSLLDGDRQWFKSVRGLAIDQTPLSQSFCAHAVGTPAEVFVVADATADDRFRENELVTGEPGIRAYAGAPLVTPEGVPLGTICAIDTAPRSFTPAQLGGLAALARRVVAQLEVRRRLGELELSQRRLESLNEQLDQFAYIVSHDLKAPIRHQASFAQLLLEDYAADLDEDQTLYLTKIIEAGARAQQIISDLNTYVHTVQTAFGTRHELSLARVVEQVVELAEVPPHVTVAVELGGVDRVESNGTALRHILVNLLSNALKFNDKEAGLVAIEASRDEGWLSIAMRDNGPGITDSDQRRIFDLFSRGQGASDLPGRGLGLAIAAKLTQNLGGELTVGSEVGRGATFTVRLPRE